MIGDATFDSSIRELNIDDGLLVRALSVVSYLLNGSYMFTSL
jgi:hypothetical protein